MAHIETREVKKQATPSAKVQAAKDAKSSQRSNMSNFDESHDITKDNEDPNATYLESVVDQFEPSEFRGQFDGWSLYKKNRISFAPVRRYQLAVDQDYKKNKVTVCAHLQNIYNSYCVKRGKATPGINNYFDIDKWSNKI